MIIIIWEENQENQEDALSVSLRSLFGRRCRHSGSAKHWFDCVIIIYSDNMMKNVTNLTERFVHLPVCATWSLMR